MALSDAADPFFGDPTQFDSGAPLPPDVGSANAIPPAIPPQPVGPPQPPAPPGFFGDHPLAPKPPPGTPLGGTGLASAAAPPPAGLASMQPSGPPAPVQGVGATPGAVLGAGQPAPGGSPISPEMAMALAQRGQGGARPAGWSPTSRTVEGTQFAPGTIDARAQQLEGEANLVDAQLGAEGARGGPQAEADRRLAAYDEVQARDDARWRAHQQAALTDHVQHIEELQAAADQAGKIDPQRFWHNKGLAARAGLALGAALGGFGAALTHTQNGALEIIQNAWDKDIDAQKAAADNARATLGEAKSVYQLNREKYGDDERARLATELQQRTTFASQLQAQVDNAAAPAESRLRAQQLMQPVLKDIADKRQELDEKTVKATTTERFRDAASGGADPLATLQKAAAIRKAGAELEGTDLATRKGEADLTKETAETAKLGTDANGGREAFEKAAANVTSTSPWSDPGKALSQHFQGTEGQQAALQREGYNSIVMAAVMRNHPGLARNRELFDQAVNAYLVHDLDTPTTIERKKALARQNLFNGPSAIGVPSGAGTPLEPDE